MVAFSGIYLYLLGENIPLLKKFLNLLKCRTKYSNDEPSEFLIDDTFTVPGVGTVVSGSFNIYIEKQIYMIKLFTLI